MRVLRGCRYCGLIGEDGCRHLGALSAPALTLPASRRGFGLVDLSPVVVVPMNRRTGMLLANLW
jgi:hypothetical protein